MAVTPTTITELNDLAKDYFSEVYQPLVNAAVPLKAQFSSLQGATFTGRKWIFAVKTAIGGGSANAGANKSLPPAAEGKYDQGEIGLVRTYTRMALDNFAIEVTKQQQGSYRPALAETMADRLQAHDLEVNRQLYSAGDGKLALIKTTANSATQALEKDYGIIGTGTRHVYEDDMVAVYSSDFATKRGTFTVTAKDDAAVTVTLDSAVNATAGDVVTRATADTDNHVATEALGLSVSVASGGADFEGIPSAGRWNATVKSNGGVVRPLSDGLILETLVEVRTKSTRMPNLAVTRPGVTLKYSESFLPLRQIQGQDVQLVGGFRPVTAIIHGGGAIPVLEDPDCPDQRLFLLDTDSFRMADLVGTGFFDGDGAQFIRISDKDAIEGFIRKYWGLACVQRNANAVITDIEDISSIDRIAA